MKRKSWKRVSCGLLLIVLAASPVAAGDLKSTYLTPEQIDLQRVLPPPPAEASDEAKADLATVRRLVSERNSDQEARITADLPCAAIPFAAGILGSTFTASNVPLTSALIERAFADSELAVIAAKSHFYRKRPYVLDPKLATFGQRSGSTSYPSGHATCGRVMAVILAAMVPEKASALFAQGELYGRNRMLAGTHFPSDLKAGETAGSVVAAALFRNPRFQADFQRSKTETRKALGLDADKSR